MRRKVRFRSVEFSENRNLDRSIKLPDWRFKFEFLVREIGLLIELLKPLKDLVSLKQFVWVLQV